MHAVTGGTGHSSDDEEDYENLELREEEERRLCRNLTLKNTDLDLSDVSDGAEETTLESQSLPGQTGDVWEEHSDYRSPDTRNAAGGPSRN